MTSNIASSLFSCNNDLIKRPDLFGHSMSKNTRQEEDPFESADEARKRRAMIKELFKEDDGSKDQGGTNIFEKLSSLSDTEDDDKEIKKAVSYNYREVANKIRQAKTSVSAAQAVIAAKRKVAEIKRKISAEDGDPEVLQLSLTHAKRMEMAARKKRHDLELEELIEHTSARDDRMEKAEEARDHMKQSMTEAAEEELSEKEDAVFEERMDMLEEAKEASPDLLSNMNAAIAEYGEDLLEALEEQMEQLECMEVVDPHMSDEDLKDLKIKHRAAEDKAMMKADMDYLKGMIKHMQDKTGAVSGSAAIQSTAGIVSPPAGLLFAAVTDYDIEDAPNNDIFSPTTSFMASI